MAAQYYILLRMTMAAPPPFQKIIHNVLINELGFNGIIITDDMEMNAIKDFSKFEADTAAVNAGVNMFIFRNTTKEI